MKPTTSATASRPPITGGRRTCSNTESLIAVSWCRSAAPCPVGIEIQVVTDSLRGRSRLVAHFSVRLFERATARICVDGRRIATLAFSGTIHEAGGLGCLYHRLVELPSELADGHPHIVTVFVERPQHDHATLATHETAFYARRASNRRLGCTPPELEDCPVTVRAG
jgi:hypothetical protein